jgi:uncharacterized protein (TIGR02246 family)
MKPMSSESRQIEDFAARYTAAWCGQDPTAVAAFFSPDGSLVINGGVPATGRDAITQVAQSFMTAFPDLRVAMDRLVIGGDHVEYHWTLTGTNTGPGSTGNSVEISGFERWAFDAEGFILASQGQFDSADYNRQLQR